MGKKRNKISILNSLTFLFAFILVSFFYVSDATAQYCSTNNIAPISCGPSSRRESGSCTFASSGLGGLYTVCESCDYQFLIAAEACYDANNVHTGTGPAAGAECTEVSSNCSYAPVGGCSSNADCPHPPDILCDTSCNAGSCQQVDPTCGAMGGGGYFCGDGICNSPETSANCPSDCGSNPAPSVSLSVDPALRIITPGGSTYYTVTVTPINGYMWGAALFVDNCPANATCFIEADITRSGRDPWEVDLSYGVQTATLTVITNGNIAINDYPLLARTNTGNSVYPVLRVIPGNPSNVNASVTGICPSRSVTITWTAGAGATAYNIYRNTTNSIPATPLAQTYTTSYVDNPAAGSTYYYWVQSVHLATGNVSSIVASAPVTVNHCEPVADIKANGSDGPIFISHNSSASISWTSISATACSISSNPSINSWSGLSGTQPSANITVDTTFTATCTGPGGQDTDSVLVRIPPPVSGATFNCPLPGTTANFSWTLPAGYTQSFQYLKNDTTNTVIWNYEAYTGTSRSFPGTTPGNSYTWYIHSREPGTGSFSNYQGGSFTCGVSPPTVDLKVNGSDNPPTISYDSTATVTWTSANATSCSFSSGPGSGGWTGTSGTQTTPQLTANTTVYTINCTNASGNSVSDTVNVRIPPPPTGPLGSCPAPGTAGSISWTYPSGYSWGLVRALDNAEAWSCSGPNQLCTGGYNSTSYNFTNVSSNAPAMVPGHNYGWWVHTYDNISGAISNSAGGSFTCVGQAAFTVAPATMNFTAVQNSAPAQQILGTTNTGTANLNYTVTTDQAWCRVNGVNNSGSVPGGIGYPPTNQTQNVAITMDALTTPGTYYCTITVSDPAASLPNSRPVNVTYTVTPNPLAAICDSTWRVVPGSGYTPSQPVGTYLPNTPNIQNNWANAVVVRGGDSAIYYQSCNYSLGIPCVWNSSYAGLTGTTNYPPFTDTPAAWGVYHYGTDNNTYLKWNSNTGWPGSWTNLGVSAKNWGQPFRWTDVYGRAWQTKRNSDGTIHYYCTAPGGAPVCEPLHFNPDPTRSSVSPGSVTAGGSFTTRCDYDSSGINSIKASVTGGGSCVWASFDKTSAVFNCTAGGTLGSQTVTCSLDPAESSNVCAQSNTVGTVNVTAAPQASFNISPTTMSFSAVTGNPPPNSQTLRTTNTSSLWVSYTATSNQGWCFINGNTSLTPSPVSIDPAFPNSDVSITVADPDVVGPATHTCIITVNDPAASPPTRTLTVTYTVTNPVGGAGPATVSLNNSTCGQMTVNWSAVASATSYNVYRNTTGSAPVAGDLVQSGLTGTTWTNTGVTPGLYYYWVSAIVGGVETTKVAPNSGSNLNPTAVNVCNQGNLNTSDKDIVSINGTVYSSNNCGGTDPIASGVSLKLADKLKFQLNLCNSGTGSASNLIVRDTMTNLQMITTETSFKAVYNGTNLTYDGACSGTNPPAVNNHYCVYGTSPNQTLVFNLSGASVPASGGRILTFEAQLTVPASYTQPSARFQNSFTISYDQSAGNSTITPILSTPLILFSTGKGVPIIIEVP